MKAKIRQVWMAAGSMSVNEEVHVEIQTFLQALNSYPDRFARDPEVTFEQHRCSLIADAKSEPMRAR